MLLCYLIRGYFIFEINSYPNLFKRSFFFLFFSSFFFLVYERRVNFKKYEKTNLPNFDHLMNSSVYKMIHKMEKEPKRGIPARPAKVNAAEDIIERVVSIFDIQDPKNFLLLFFFFSFQILAKARSVLKPSPRFFRFRNLQRSVSRTTEVLGASATEPLRRKDRILFYRMTKNENRIDLSTRNEKN